MVEGKIGKSEDGLMEISKWSTQRKKSGKNGENKKHMGYKEYHIFTMKCEKERNNNRVEVMWKDNGQEFFKTDMIHQLQIQELSKPQAR